MNDSYQLVSNGIVDEDLDQETIVINLITGIYYSLNCTGSLIWKGIREHFCITDIIASLQNTQSDSAEVSSWVYSFIKALEQKELIQTSSTGFEKRQFHLGNPNIELIAPSFDKYEDMAEMLLADPIHEVAADGWPEIKPE